MKFFNIAIYRKIPAENIYPKAKQLPATLNIELGKWWEIIITREMAEHFTGYSKLVPSKVFTDGTLTKLIKDGEIIPFWYGYAYYDFNRDCAAYCPVPINFAVAGARWLRRKWYEFKQAARRFNEKDESRRRIVRSHINTLCEIQNNINVPYANPELVMFHRAELDKVIHVLNAHWRELA